MAGDCTLGGDSLILAGDWTCPAVGDEAASEASAGPGF